MKTTTLLAATLAAILLQAVGTARAGGGPDYTLHEWGTFTTVIGSDGTHLDGVHREDAPLPGFVYELDAPPKQDPQLRGAGALDQTGWNHRSTQRVHSVG